MTKLKRTLKELIKNRFKAARMSEAERYLASSQSIEDVERRLRELSHKGL